MVFCCLIVVFSDFVLLCVSWVCGFSVVSVLCRCLMLSGWLFVFWGGGLCEFRLANFVVVGGCVCCLPFCFVCAVCSLLRVWVMDWWFMVGLLVSIARVGFGLWWMLAAAFLVCWV